MEKMVSGLLVTAVVISAAIECCAGQLYRCPKGTSGSMVVFRDKCYRFVPHDRTWDAAQADCRHHGGNLVHIKDHATQMFIYNMVRPHGTLGWAVNGVWIGAYDKAKNNKYEWVNGGSVRWSNWAAGQPSCSWFSCVEFCGQMRLDDHGKWHDKKCDPLLTAYRYCCMYDMAPKSTTTSTTTTTTSTTTTTTTTPVPTTTTTMTTTTYVSPTTTTRTTETQKIETTNTSSLESSGTPGKLPTSAGPPVAGQQRDPMQKESGLADGSLSGGMIAGISVGLLVLLCLIILIIILLRRRRTQKKSEQLSVGYITEVSAGQGTACPTPHTHRPHNDWPVGAVGGHPARSDRDETLDNITNTKCVDDDYSSIPFDRLNGLGAGDRATYLTARSVQHKILPSDSEDDDLPGKTISDDEDSTDPSGYVSMRDSGKKQASLANPLYDEPDPRQLRVDVPAAFINPYQNGGSVPPAVGAPSNTAEQLSDFPSLSRGPSTSENYYGHMDIGRKTSTDT